jgi:hypothetical protein
MRSKIWRRPLPTLVAAALLTVTASLASVAAGTDAAAAPVTAVAVVDPVPGGFASWDELFAVQQRMDRALARITETARIGGYSGYGNAIAAPENRILRLYWQGAIPAPLRQVIAEESKNIPIEVLPARYSMDHMLRTAERLMRHKEIAAAEPATDATALVVHLLPGAALSAAASTEIATAPAAVSIGGPQLPAQPSSGRLDDSPPYYAGGRLVSAATTCTTGFPVSIGSTSLLFTAAHCVVYPETVIDGGGDTMGPVFRDNNGRDIALIQTNSSGRMFDGSYTSSFSKPVQSAAGSAVGNWLCTSGSFSGVRCSIQVKSVNLSINTSVGTISPVVMSEQSSHANAAGPGDSGGPVFSLPSPDNGKVIAKGTMSAVDTTATAPCTGVTGRTCSWRLYYTDIVQSMNWYGLTIKTSS